MKWYLFIKELSTDRQNIAEEYDNIANNIIQEINKLGLSEDISTLLHYQGTNVIELDFKSKGLQLTKILLKISNIASFGGFKQDYRPVDEVKKAIEDYDFFKAYAMGSTLIESYGTNILKKFFKKNNTNCDLEHISLHAIIVMLYTHKLINQKFYENMIHINKEIAC